MLLLNILLLLACVCVYGQNKTCNICIIDSVCGDDYIHFNISVSSECKNPVDIFYNYNTDVEPAKHHLNTTIDCHGCYFDLTVDPVRDAWDYTLTLESPKSTKVCSVYIAHCGGSTSLILWYVTAGLSGLFTILGCVLCIARYYRAHQKIKTSQKIIKTPVVNS